MTQIPLLQRRQVLQAGAVFGLGFADVLRATSRSPLDDEFPARASSVIHVHLPGGLAQQDSFAPKPYAPLAYRGQTRAIDTTKRRLALTNRFLLRSCRAWLNSMARK